MSSTLYKPPPLPNHCSTFPSPCSTLSAYFPTIISLLLSFTTVPPCSFTLFHLAHDSSTSSTDSTPPLPPCSSHCFHIVQVLFTSLPLLYFVPVMHLVHPGRHGPHGLDVILFVTLPFAASSGMSLGAYGLWGRGPLFIRQNSSV